MIFEKITLAWLDKEYVIQPNGVMGVIACIEEIVTLGELHAMMTDQRQIKLGRIARAYGAALRYAGADVGDDEIYTGMFGDKQDQAVRITQALTGLIAMLVPPGALKQQGEKTPKNRDGRSGAATNSPKSSIKRQSAQTD